MKILELFSGTKSISKVFASNGWQTFTVDNNKELCPDLCVDMLYFDISMLPKEWRCPDVIWASPPCTTFSVASIYRYWEKGKPKNSKAHIGIALLLKTIETIKQLNPKFFFIENPRGMMRKQPVMAQFVRRTVTYCQYGLNVQKPTDIWTNCIEWIPKPMCSPGDTCHEQAKRGSDRGTQNQHRNPMERGIIPEQLCEEIYLACIGKQKEKQLSLNT
jgi:site-specific DNA-cytosine methylase